MDGGEGEPAEDTTLAVITESYLTVRLRCVSKGQVVTPQPEAVLMNYDSLELYN